MGFKSDKAIVSLYSIPFKLPIGHKKPSVRIMTVSEHIRYRLYLYISRISLFVTLFEISDV